MPKRAARAPHPSFPYAERAAAAEAARQTMHTAFAAVRRRDDIGDPATRAWLAAIQAFHVAMYLAWPPGFADNLDRLRRGDARGLDSMIEFLEADPYFFGSGYAKVDVLKAVRRIALTDEQADCLRRVVLRVLDTGGHREFRHYCHLARQIRSSEFEASIERRAETGAANLRRRAGWMLQAIRQKP